MAKNTTTTRTSGDTVQTTTAPGDVPTPAIDKGPTAPANVATPTDDARDAGKAVKQSSVAATRVTLKATRHTHAGKLYNRGDKLDVDASTARRLIDQGIAEG